MQVHTIIHTLMAHYSSAQEWERKVVIGLMPIDNGC